MPISLRTTKMLWGRAGNRCAVCRAELVIDPSETDDDESIVGDMAHIVARKEGFTRGDADSVDAKARDNYGNLILLCKIHHKQIDNQPTEFTVEKLKHIKAEHEAWVRERLSEEDVRKQRDDETYAAYVQEFLERLSIDEWTVRGTWVCSPDGPEIDKKYLNSIKQLGPWIISRLWPGRYKDIESRFHNFHRVLTDFIDTFSRHAEETGDDDRVCTRRFYKSDEWIEKEKYDRLADQYNEHTALVEDLFLELTRALNYIFDSVRSNLLPTFRIHEGVLLVERDGVGMGMRVQHLRTEYRGDERNHAPYPGLEEFKEIRYSRDFSIQREEWT